MVVSSQSSSRSQCNTRYNRDIQRKPSLIVIITSPIQNLFGNSELDLLLFDQSREGIPPSFDCAMTRGVDDPASRCGNRAIVLLDAHAHAPRCAKRGGKPKPEGCAPGKQRLS